MMEASSPPEGGGDRPAVRSRLRVLSFSLLYPNPTQPNQGVFIERRLKRLADIADLQVISPFAVVQYGNPKGKRIRIGNTGCPVRRQDGRIAVSHPRWFYPPCSGSLTPFWLFAQMLHRIARLRHEFAFEILDAHFGFPDGIAGGLLASALGVPFTITFRGNEPKHSRTWLGHLLMAHAVRRASRVFTVSERLRRFAIALGADPAKVRTIPNGVDGAVFRERNRTACRIQHGLALDVPVVLSAGALVKRKGHHRIIEAVHALSTEGVGAQLVIAGGPGPEGQFERTLRALVSKFGLERSVRFLGPVSAETLAEVMAAADVFCLASTNEGWPNVVHEALACGTPVVGTDVGAVPEMLADDRGIVVPVNEPIHLKEALKTALQKNWDRHAMSAWARARSWDRVASEVREEMEMLLQNKSYERPR
jgi:glycosyltransferase involved in cell wall biosynthesis